MCYENHWIKQLLFTFLLSIIQNNHENNNQARLTAEWLSAGAYPYRHRTPFVFAGRAITEYSIHRSLNNGLSNDRLTRRFRHAETTAVRANHIKSGLWQTESIPFSKVMLSGTDYLLSELCMPYVLRSSGRYRYRCSYVRCRKVLTETHGQK